MIHTQELTPFVDSLRMTSASFVHEEPRANYEFHSQMYTVGAASLWHHPAMRKVNFKTYFGEYLNLFLDEPPMLEWIEEWQQEKIPWMLDDLEDLLRNDSSLVSSQTHTDIQEGIHFLAKSYGTAKNNPEYLAELWRHFDILRPFYTARRKEFSVETQDLLQKINTARDMPI